MKALALYLFPLLLILGGAIFGWLARWYAYGGRCKPGGVCDGIPNVDITRGTVALDGSEPAAGGKTARLMQAFGAAPAPAPASVDRDKKDVAQTRAVAGIGSAAPTALAGAAPSSTIGQEDGDTTDSLASLAIDGDDAAPAEVSIPTEFSDAEQEAQILIDSDADIPAPASLLSAPEAGRSPDDLQRIKGIGPKIAGSLNGKGIYYFDQIASFGAQEIAWADRTLAVKGRVVRDRWVPQAQGLAALTSGLAADDAGDIAAEDILEEDDHDTASLQSRFAAVAEEEAQTSSDDAAPAEVSIPTEFSDAEQEAQILIDSDADIPAPASLLSAPEAGRSPDDLQRIKGIGPKIAGSLNGKGIYYFDQIASFGAQEIAWADRTLAVKGRVVRDRWVPQAQGLAALGEAVASPVSAPVSDTALSDSPLRLAEAEALRLIQRDGGYAASAENRPAMLMLDGPVGGAPDDLKRIKGVGEKMERLLNGLGVYYFRQIASFTASDIAWIDSKLKFKGRVIRDRWVPQADAFERARDT